MAVLLQSHTASPCFPSGTATPQPPTPTRYAPPHAMQNLMREYVRNNDRAMSNLEALPGGFNALRQLYENVQEPLMNATQNMAAGAEGGGADNSALAGMLAALGGGGAAGAAAGGAGGAAANPGETQPLPNPWAAGGGAGAGAAAAPGLPGLGGLGGMGGLPGMDSGMQSAMMQQVRLFAIGGGADAGKFAAPGVGWWCWSAYTSLPLNTHSLSPPLHTHTPVQMMENPQMMDMMATMMSQPGVLDSIVASNPMLQQMVGANPMLRQMLSNPEVVRSMLNPQMMQNAMRMQQVGCVTVGGGGDCDCTLVCTLVWISTI